MASNSDCNLQAAASTHALAMAGVLAGMALVLSSGLGCAQLHRTPDQCGYALDRCELIRELDCLLDCNCPGCSVYRDTPVCGESLDCSVAVAEAPCPTPPPRPCSPPLVRYRPPEPPTFLTVPTQPVLVASPPDVPKPARGSVEVGYRRELAFPGGL